MYIEKSLTQFTEIKIFSMIEEIFLFKLKEHLRVISKA